VVSSVLIGASRPSQLADNVQAIHSAPFSSEDLAEIDRHAVDGDLNIWLASSNA
jgi:L-glyceraldehyde 3-phosphate reductase